MKVPVRLQKPPLVEAIWELRFEPAVPSASEQLHGILFGLRRERPQVRLLTPPGLPSDMLAAIGWQERPVKALSWNDGLTVQFGDRVISVHIPGELYGRYYENFRDKIREVLEYIQEDIINKVTQTSLRYINVINYNSSKRISDVLRVNITIGRLNRQTILSNFYLRWEDSEKSGVYIYQIGAPARIQRPGSGVRVGVAVDIDSIASDIPSAEGLSREVREAIISASDRIHDELKFRFFDLLTAECLENLGPIWEEP